MHARSRAYIYDYTFSFHADEETLRESILTQTNVGVPVVQPHERDAPVFAARGDLTPLHLSHTKQREKKEERDLSAFSVKIDSGEGRAVQILPMALLCERDGRLSFACASRCKRWCINMYE